MCAHAGSLYSYFQAQRVIIDQTILCVQDKVMDASMFKKELHQD